MPSLWFSQSGSTGCLNHRILLEREEMCLLEEKYKQTSKQTDKYRLNLVSSKPISDKTASGQEPEQTSSFLC